LDCNYKHGNQPYFFQNEVKINSEEKKEKGFYYIESAYGSFRRELTLPTDVDPEKIDAVCKDGVLSITLPKAEKAKTVKIKVKG
jgi:HSP20 family protein